MYSYADFTPNDKTGLWDTIGNYDMFEKFDTLMRQFYPYEYGDEEIESMLQDREIVFDGLDLFVCAKCGKILPHYWEYEDELCQECSAE